MRTLLTLLPWCLLVVGCVHAPPPAPAPAEPAPASSPAPEVQGPGLSFEVEPPDAELILDGESRGPVPQGVLLLPPGVYQVSLKASGYATWRAEVSVGTRVERVKVQLPRR